MTMINQATFQRDYPGIRSIFSDILVPVFGSTTLLNENIIGLYGLKRQAAEAKIEKITRIAEYDLDGAPLNIFDVQLAPDVNLSHSRVNIKRLLVSQVDVFSSSLIFFHYEDVQGKEWRISYFAKGRGNTDTTAAKRYTFLCGPGHGCRTVAERFELLRREPDKTRAALTKVFSVETLNKEFYQKLANWFFWALRVVRFPEGETDPEKNAVPLIRLITRVIFVWFMRKKDLVPDQLFDRSFVESILKPGCDDSAYYRAILQNLFFATLNTEQTDPEARKFRIAERHRGRNEQYHIYSVYRYEDFFTDDGKARFLELMRDIPFLNGGLFSCLDDNESNTPVDAFSDQAARRKLLSVPDELFWTTEEEHRRVDLSEAYGDTSRSSEPVVGLVTLLDQYNFTVDESSRDEATVALDPELLGVVFENLLASYNPETKTTARKQTGSFYTPREIVDYMVEESLIRYLLSRGIGGITEEQLRTLVVEDTLPDSFTAAQKRAVIDALKSCRVLDPACGSGAFPMGLLQIVVRIWDRLDPVGSFEEQYKRKLYLIRNCIFGVDIQPIAVQISKLRCFISLLADSEIDDDKPNRGIEPLPNLEMHFVAANSLLDVNLSAFNEWINDPVLKDFTSQIRALRNRFFTIKRYADKKALRQEDKDLRGKLKNELIRLANGGYASKIAFLNDKIAKLQQERTKYLDPDIREMAPHEEDAELLDFAKPDRSDSLPIDVNAVKRGEIDSQIRRCQAALKKELRVDDQAVYDEATKLADWNPFDQMATAPFFNPKWMFGHDGCFDIVIGNPPYVRADNPDADYQAERTAIRASGMYETLYEKWDLFIAFLERGYQLLAENGVEAFIVSDAYCHAKYALRSQEWFLSHARIPRIDFCGDLQIFEAAVHNVIPFFERADGADNTPLRRLHTEKFGNVTALPSDIQANLTPRSTFFPGADNTAAKAELPGVPLGDICYITYGLRPSSDEDDPDEFTTADLVSTTRDAVHSKKYVEGKHLSPWVILQWLWLEWGTDRAPGRFCRKTFPELYQVREKLLAQRSPGPDPIISFDSSGLIFTPACVGFILWRDLRGVRNRSLMKSARYDDETPKDDLPRREDLEEISLRFPLRYLLAVMNSTPAKAFLRANRRSNIHLYPDDWKPLPIPEATREQQRPIIALVNRILALKQADPTADITALESELDKMVAMLYEAV